MRLAICHQRTYLRRILPRRVRARQVRARQVRATHVGPRLVQDGVVLLEVLVAFSILTMSLAVLLHSVSGSLKQHRIVENRLIATTHAANILAGLGIESPLNPGNKSGNIDERFSWQLTASEAASSGLAADREEEVPKLLSLELKVRWNEGAVVKEYVVTTKRIAVL